MSVKLKLLIITAIIAPLFETQNIKAQSVPTPAPAQSQTIVLKGGTAHTATGKIIENSLIVLENGKIKIMTDAYGSRFLPDPRTQQVIDVSQKHIYPGFIAMDSQIGLIEIEAVRATNDLAETGDLNPNARSIIAYNTDSHVTPTIRSNGVLMAQVTPTGGRISGTASVVQLDAWNWEDATYTADNGLYLNFPSKITYKGWWAEPEGIEKNDKYTEAINSIKQLLNEAKAYCNGEILRTQANVPQNLKLQALCNLFDQKQTLFIRTNGAPEIIDAVNLAKEFGLKIAIVGAREAWMVTDILKQNNVPVVLVKTHTLPSNTDDNIDIMYKLPQILVKEGITVAITSENFWDTRNLPFEAGSTAAYGLTPEQALQTITLNPATILGISQTTGSLEEGKDATLIVSSGDALDMRTNHIEHAFIQGRKIDLGNKQTDLYKKFTEKYGLK